MSGTMVALDALGQAQGIPAQNVPDTVGGEGEILGVVDQQRPVALSAGWGSSMTGDTLERLAKKGHDFLVCNNLHLPINDDSVDLVLTNSVPIDVVVLGEPGVQSSEIRRILASGGEWVHDGNVRHIKS